MWFKAGGPSRQASLPCLNAERRGMMASPRGIEYDGKAEHAVAVMGRSQMGNGE